MQAVAVALADIGAGFRMSRVWLTLAGEDIDDQHRRTTLGPFWLLINYLMFAGTFVVLFKGNSGSENYVAYVSVGLLVWFFISEVIGLSVSLYVREESFIKGTRLPLSVYVLRLVMQSIIRSGYAAIGCVIILAFAGVATTAAWGWALMGVLLLLVVSPAVVMILAVLGAYFPDLQFVVSNVMRIGMFVTPIFWVESGAGGLRGAFYHFNPFTYFLEIVRIPIVDGQFPTTAFALCIATGLILWAAAIFVHGKCRYQIVFVL